MLSSWHCVNIESASTFSRDHGAGHAFEIRLQYMSLKPFSLRSRQTSTLASRLDPSSPAVASRPANLFCFSSKRKPGMPLERIIAARPQPAAKIERRIFRPQPSRGSASSLVACVNGRTAASCSRRRDRRKGGAQCGDDGSMTPHTEVPPRRFLPRESLGSLDVSQTKAQMNVAKRYSPFRSRTQTERRRTQKGSKIILKSLRPSVAVSQYPQNESYSSAE